MSLSDLESGSADPGVRAASLIHDGEDPNFVIPDVVKEAVGKTVTQTSADRSHHDRSRMGGFQDGLDGPPNLSQKRCAQTGLFKLIIVDGLVELQLRKPVEGNPHGSKSFRGVAKHLFRRSAAQRSGIQGFGAPLGFFAPDAFVLLWRKGLQTFKQSTRQMSSGFRIKLHGFSFEVLHVHDEYPNAAGFYDHF